MRIELRPGMTLRECRVEAEQVAVSIEVTDEADAFWIGYTAVLHRGAATEDAPGVQQRNIRAISNDEGDPAYAAELVITSAVPDRLWDSARLVAEAWATATGEPGSADSENALRQRFAGMMTEMRRWHDFASREHRLESPQDVIDMLDQLGEDEDTIDKPGERGPAATPEELERLL